MSNKIMDVDIKELKKKYKSDLELSNIIKKIEEEDYPVQYAIGYVPFLNVKINTDERALIPRFSTELLVQKLITYINKYKLDNSSIIDICSGSGCIGIALKKEFPNSNVTLVEKSSLALSLSKENALLNETRVHFIESDILTSEVKGKYSIIVANPPYVRLDEEVSNNTKYEPYMALYPGEDELLFYKAILKYSYKHHKDNFIIALEIGAKQGKRIIYLAKKYFPSSKILLEKDYDNYDRFIFILNVSE